MGLRTNSKPIILREWIRFRALPVNSIKDKSILHSREAIFIPKYLLYYTPLMISWDHFLLLLNAADQFVKSKE